MPLDITTTRNTIVYFLQQYVDDLLTEYQHDESVKAKCLECLKDVAEAIDTIFVALPVPTSWKKEEIND